MVLISSFIIEHNTGLKVFFDYRNMSVKEKITHLLNKLKKIVLFLFKKYLQN